MLLADRSDGPDCMTTVRRHLGQVRPGTIVGGDARSYSIAAASIFAKVTRDRYMARLAESFPGYGWETNRGYGSEEHLVALQCLGPTPHHRMSFSPLNRLL